MKRVLSLLATICFLAIFCWSCGGGGGGNGSSDPEEWYNSLMRIEALGNNEFKFQINIRRCSNITGDAYIIGIPDWNIDSLIKMERIENGSDWFEYILQLESGIYSFSVTDEFQDRWANLNEIDNHPLVVPNIWIDPEVDPNDRVIAFKVTGPDSYEILDGPIPAPCYIEVEELGNNSIRLMVDVKNCSDIDWENKIPSIIGFNGDWENPMQMTAISDRDGWFEITFEFLEEGIYSFSIFDGEAGDEAKWLWLEYIRDRTHHQLVIPAIWINPGEDESNLILAFGIDAEGGLYYLDGPIDIEVSDAIFLKYADGKIHLEVNIWDYSNIVDNPCIVGLIDWDNLIPMTLIADKPGWFEIDFESLEQGTYSFVITNSDRTEWIWLGLIYQVAPHPLVIPVNWINPEDSSGNLIMAFGIDAEGNLYYLDAEWSI